MFDTLFLTLIPFLLTDMQQPTTNLMNEGNGIVLYLLMATPNRPHLNLKALQLLHSPKAMHGTHYIWADARTNPSVAPGSAE